jgi:topoisomerase-4 subunit A
MSISPNACIIVQDRPHFLDVHDILTRCTFQTRDLLKRELEIRRGELEELMHFASLEKVFIENRIYHKIETAESWEQVLEIIPMQLKKYVVPIEEKPRSNDKRIRLFRPVNENDVSRLTEIKIKRISKYNAFAVEEYLQKLQKEYEQVKFNLDHLNDYSIQYFENLLKKYGKGRERKTEIRVFDTIQAAEVVANNAKLYANFKEGFIGLGLKKDDFISDCSDIDDIIVFRKDGKFQVVKVADKVFVGKDLLHVAVWRKGDERTTYNLVYLDGKTGVTYAKRFNVTAITRSAEYDLTQGNPNSRVLYFTSNPNSESEIVEIGLSQSSTALKKVLSYDFAELAIKGRTAHGNIVSKYPVRRVTQKEAGKSTIGAKKIWMDSVSGKLNADERGQYLGEYDTGDKIIAIYKDGTYEICEPEINKYFEINPLCHIGKWDMETVVAAVYFDGNKEWTMVKRFKIETSKINERFLFVTEHKKTQLLFVSVESNQKFQYSIKLGSKKVDGVANLDELAEIKGWKAIGNKMTDQKIMNVSLVVAEEQDAITLFDA